MLSRQNTQSAHTSNRKARFWPKTGAIAILIANIACGQGRADDLPNCMVDAPTSEAFAPIVGDFPPHEGWMMRQMVGRTLSYENGMTERFNKDGTYEFSMGGETRAAPHYRFYSGVHGANAGGFVCIDFPDLRFQRYVVHQTKLTLIDGYGDRYVATVE